MIAKIYTELPRELNECVKCHFPLPLSEFRKDQSKKNGLKSWCKWCAWGLPSFPKVPKQFLDGMGYYRLHKYGVNEIDYQQMLLEQNNKCAICGIPQAELVRSLSIDHCHTTGKVRGLLCRKCNFGIGNLGDNINILRAAIAYLEK